MQTNEIEVSLSFNESDFMRSHQQKFNLIYEYIWVIADEQ